MSVCIAVLTSGSVHYKCAESMGRAIAQKTVASAFYHRSGPNVDDGRNDIVRTFNAGPCEYLLMVDSDIEFIPQDILQLAQDDLPIVSGVVYGAHHNGGIRPAVHRWITGEGRRSMVPIDVWPDGARLTEQCKEPIVAVDGVGAAFLMIKREVLDAFEKAYADQDPCLWFAEETHGRVHFGEDLTFCIRAKQLDIPIYVDRRVQLAHYKEAKLGGRPRDATPPAGSEGAPRGLHA